MALSGTTAATPVSDDSNVQWNSPNPDGPARRRLRPFALVLVLGLIGAITLVATQVTPAPNGLGLLPGDQAILEHSGVTLQFPTGKPTVSRGKAVAAAIKGQPQAQPLHIVLVTAVGVGGSAISPPGRLCWVVILNTDLNSVVGSEVPGQIQLDAVLVDARTGAVIEGFISFHGTTPHSQVGTE